MVSLQIADPVPIDLAQHTVRASELDAHAPSGMASPSHLKNVDAGLVDCAAHSPASVDPA